MPVVLTHTVDAESLQVEDFSVVRQSGASSTPICVTLRPAADIGERRTILIIGEFGNADNDPPVNVAIVQLSASGQSQLACRYLFSGAFFWHWQSGRF